jgi:hypothetical protein
VVDSSSFYGSKEWANSTLKASIVFLKEGANSENFWLWNQRLAVVLIFKKELEEKGFFWQSNRIENHIHRLQPRKADLKEERGASF